MINHDIILNENRALKVENGNQHWLIEHFKFQRVINAQRRVEIGARTLDMIDEYERLLRKTP